VSVLFSLLRDTTTITTILRHFDWDCSGELVPEETFTHSHLSSTIFDQLPPSTTISVQFTCLAVFLHNLCPSPLWCTSLSGPSSSYHTPYISLPNHCVLFATHAHTNAICFAVVPILCFLFLVSQLFTWNSIFYFNATHPSDHFHLSLIINDVSILVSNGTNCVNLFHPVRILFSTAASACPSTFDLSPK